MIQNHTRQRRRNRIFVQNGFQIGFQNGFQIGFRPAKLQAKMFFKMIFVHHQDTSSEQALAAAADEGKKTKTKKYMKLLAKTRSVVKNKPEAKVLLILNL